MFLDHTQRRSTVGRTPLDECSARRRDLYLKTHDTHNRQISMPPVGFEPTISAGERRDIKNGCSIYIYDISGLRVKRRKIIGATHSNVEENLNILVYDAVLSGKYLPFRTASQSRRLDSSTCK